jgi:hypothetical protein
MRPIAGSNPLNSAYSAETPRTWVLSSVVSPNTTLADEDISAMTASTFSE